MKKVEEINEAGSEQQVIQRMCKLLLESQEKIIKEKYLLNLVQNDEELFQDVISEVNTRFERIGYELIRTTFMQEVYYLLATSGMDKQLTPQMYGIMGLIFSFQKEFGRDLTLEEAKNIFGNVWDEISYLKEQGYLHEHTYKNTTSLLITPTGKVLFKDILTDISLNSILENIGD